jgi:hypothetical protein
MCTVSYRFPSLLLFSATSVPLFMPHYPWLCGSGTPVCALRYTLHTVYTRSLILQSTTSWIVSDNSVAKAFSTNRRQQRFNIVKNNAGRASTLDVIRFEVFTAVIMKNGVRWDVTPCDSYKKRRFGGTQRLPHQGDKNR